MTICCLQLSRSRMVDRWRRTDNHLTLCYNEAKDNSKYIQALEKCCHSLYLDNPVKMRNSLVRMLQTVRLIHDVSMFYNTTEKISSLMVKVIISKFTTKTFSINTCLLFIVPDIDHKPND